MEEQYFAVVEPDTKNVIGVKDLSDSLELSEYNGSSCQLWGWGRNGSLRNKNCGRVLTIVQQTGSEKFVLALDKNTGESNQKWLYETEMLQSQKGKDKNITRDESGSLAIHKADKTISKSQKWLLIPEKIWNRYNECLNSQDYEQRIALHRLIIQEHLECVLGCKIEQFSDCLAQCESTSKKIYDGLTKRVKKIGAIQLGSNFLSLISNVSSIVASALKLTIFMIGPPAIIAIGINTLVSFVCESVKLWLDNVQKDMELSLTDQQDNINNFDIEYGNASRYYATLKSIMSKAYPEVILEAPKQSLWSKLKSAVRSCCSLKSAVRSCCSKIYDYISSSKLMQNFHNYINYIKLFKLGAGTVKGIIDTSRAGSLEDLTSQNCRKFGMACNSLMLLVSLFGIFNGLNKVFNGSDLANKKLESSKEINMNAQKLIEMLLNPPAVL